MPSFIKRASQKISKHNEVGTEKEEDLVRLVKGNEQLLNRILSKEKVEKLGDAGRSISYKTPGSVPFQWEAEPGKPKSCNELEACKAKDVKDSENLFPLNLPPSRRSPQMLSRAASSSLLQTPKSLSDKMMCLLNQGKHSDPQTLTQADNYINSSDIFSYGSASDVRKSSTDFDIDFSPNSDHVPKRNSLSRDMNKPLSKVRETFKSLSFKNKPSTSQNFTSTSFSEYTGSDRSSESSSPVSFSSFSSSSSLSQDLRSLSPCSSSSSIGSNISQSTADPATLADCLLSVAEQIDSDFQTNYNPKLPTNSELLRGKYSRSYSGPLLSGSSTANNASEKLLQTYQKNISGKTSTLPSKDGVSSLESAMKQDKIEDGLRNAQYSMNSSGCRRNMGNRQNANNTSYKEHIEELIYTNTGNMASFPSVASETSSKTHNGYLADNTKPATTYNEVNKDIYHTSRLSSAMPQRRVPSLRSQEISNMLLRLAKAEEELRFRGYSLDDDNSVGPACLPICSFMGRNMVNRSKHRL